MSFFQELFTKRFIKDLIFIVITGGSLYILTHNPIVHPEPKVAHGTWSIQLMQHPLVFGVAGHNFLTLRDGENEIVQELHGLPTDPIKKTWKYIGTDPDDILQVWLFDGPRTYMAEKKYPGVTIYEGSEETVRVRWESSTSCQHKINDLSISYPPYGFNVRGDTENSNSVEYTLVQCMGLDAKHLGLLTPGWGNNLLETARK